MAQQKGFYINMQGCYGCKTCEIACKSQNKLAAGVRWRRVRTLKSEAPPAVSTLSMACNHCEKAECMRVCPVSAYSRRPDGIVVQNHGRCIGCRMCIMACPYNVPTYDPKEGKTSKCDLCAKRLDSGKKPRCVEACPAGALEVGNLSELQSQYGQDKAVIGSPAANITNPSIVINPTKTVKL